MKVQSLENRSQEVVQKIQALNFKKQVWPGQASSCEQCQYNDQDIDACPCARCHTRN